MRVWGNGKLQSKKVGYMNNRKNSRYICLSILKIKVMETVTKINEETSSPYNEEFVKKIQKSRASKGKVIQPEDLCK